MVSPRKPNVLCYLAVNCMFCVEILVFLIIMYIDRKERKGKINLEHIGM